MFRSLFKALPFIWVLFSSLNAYQYEFAITTLFQNEGRFLKEWIEYHRMVGAEHFWLYHDSSNEPSNDRWESILKPYIEEGIVEVFDWPSGGFRGHRRNQIKCMKDALKKTSGVTKWLAFIDADEYLMPRHETTIPGCIKKYFPTASGIYANWHNFGTSNITLKEGQSLLFSLTKSAPRLHPENGIGKSLLRPDHARGDLLWYVHHVPLKTGGQYYNGDAQPLSFYRRDLQLDAKVHDKYLCIHHYIMRDEAFFHGTKLPRIRGIGRDERREWEHYYAFNESQDTKICDFIRKKHPKMYHRFWKARLRKKG